MPDKKPNSAAVKTSPPAVKGAGGKMNPILIGFIVVVVISILVMGILYFTGVFNKKNKSDSTPVSKDETSPEGTDDGGGGPSPLIAPVSDGGGGDDAPAGDDVPDYPPVVVSPSGNPAPTNPYEPYEGTGIRYGKRYLLTASNIDDVATNGYGGRYVGTLMNDSTTDYNIFKFLAGKTANIDDSIYSINQIGFYLMPGLETSSGTPASSDSSAPASIDEETLDKIKTNAYIKSGDKVAIVWPPFAYTKPVANYDDTPYWRDHDFDPTKTQYMADGSAYYGSGVLKYDNEALLAEQVTRFTESTEGFIFKEDGVEDGTPISQLSNVSILYGQNLADACGVSTDTELTIHNENGVTQAGFCGTDYSDTGQTTFLIMSVLPYNVLLYGGNYNMINSSTDSTSRYVTMFSGCRTNPFGDQYPQTALTNAVGTEAYYQRCSPMVATNGTGSDNHNSCDGTKDKINSGWLVEQIGVFLLPSFDQSNFVSGIASAPASRNNAYDNLNTPVLNGSRVAIAPPQLQCPNGGIRNLYSPLGLPAAWEQSGIYGDFVLSCTDPSNRAEYKKSEDTLIPAENSFSKDSESVHPATYGFYLYDQETDIGKPLTKSSIVYIATALPQNGETDYYNDDTAKLLSWHASTSSTDRASNAETSTDEGYYFMTPANIIDFMDDDFPTPVTYQFNFIDLEGDARDMKCLGDYCS